jgi:hypothetical protein
LLISSPFSEVDFKAAMILSAGYHKFIPSKDDNLLSLVFVSLCQELSSTARPRSNFAIREPSPKPIKGIVLAALLKSYFGAHINLTS